MAEQPSTMQSNSGSVTVSRTTQAPRGTLQVYQAQNDPALSLARAFFADTAQATTQQNAESQAAEQDATTQLMEAVTRKIAAGKQFVRAEQERSQQVADVSKQVNEQFGADSLNGSSIVARKVDMNNNLDTQLTMARQEIADLEGNTFFSNPLGWLQAQMILPQKKAQYNAAVDRFNNNTRDIATLTTQAANATALQTSAIPTITGEMASAKANELEAVGQSEKATAGMQLARSNSYYAGKRLEVASMQLNEAQQENQRASTERYRELSSINDKIRWDSEAPMRELARVQYAEKIADLKMEEVAVDQAAERLGYTTTDQKAIFKNNYKRGTPEFKQRVLHTASGMFGTSPYDSYVTIGQNGNINNMSPNYQKLFRVMQQLDQQHRNSPEYAVWSNQFKTDKEREAARDDLLSRKFIEQFAVAGGNNVNAAGFELPPAAMVASMASPALPDSVKLPANHPAIMAVKTLAQNPDIIPTTQDVVQTIITNVSQNGGGIRAAAKAVTDYYKVNTLINRQNQDLGSFGPKLDIPLNYKAALQVPGTVWGSRNATVDLTDDVAVTQYLLSQLRNQPASLITGIGGEGAVNSIGSNTPAQELPANPKVLGATRK